MSGSNLNLNVQGLLDNLKKLSNELQRMKVPASIDKANQTQVVDMFFTLKTALESNAANLQKVYDETLQEYNFFLNTLKSTEEAKNLAPTTTESWHRLHQHSYTNNTHRSVTFGEPSASASSTSAAQAKTTVYDPPASHYPKPGA